MRNQKGFTLIELLVVIAIIGLLATLAIVSLRSAQQKARDTKRITDVKNIQTAVEIYYSENSAGYPNPTSWANLGTLLDEYVTAMPTPPDPNDPANDQYVYGVENTQFQEYIVAVPTGLEDGTHQALTQDAPDGTYGNGGSVIDWGLNATFVASSGAVTNPVDCTDPAYCLTN